MEDTKEEKKNEAVSAESASDLSSSRNTTVWVIAFVVIAAVLYYLFTMQSNLPSESSATGAIDPEAVVAVVNDTELTGEDLLYQMTQVAQVIGIQDLAAADEEMRGLIQAQSIDAIVNTEVLVQASQNAGLSVTAEEIDTEYATIVEQVGGQEAANERLAVLEITEEEFRRNLANDLLIARYIEVRSDGEALDATEEEARAFYNEVSGENETAPPFEEVRFQIEEQLRFQKEQEAIAGLLEELRAAANVEINI